MGKKELLQELVYALERRDPVRLRELSNNCSDEAFITQDPETIEIAIISYAFSKILSKSHYKSKFSDLVGFSLKKLKQGDYKAVIEEVKEFDRRYGFFQGNIAKKARIKIGSRLYTRGLSLSKSADLVSVNVSDILKYSGGTQLPEKTKYSVKERLEAARQVFK